MSQSKSIYIFTGGGSGGHVIPARTLIENIKERKPKCQLIYLGSETGIEAQLIGELDYVQYFPIPTGKLRRYFSWQNFLDFFKIFQAIWRSFFILRKYNPQETLLFSTGGFVSVPPVVAAKICGVEIIIHEQTSRLGLANKLSSYLANKIFISFESTASFLPAEKVYLTGAPIRKEFFSQKIDKVFIKGICLNEVNRPILFITGGGNGSLLLNKALKEDLRNLEKKYFILHQVGKNSVEEYSDLESEYYLPVAFVQDMANIFKLSDVIISRSGAGTVSELLALNKKSIFVPLKIAQKNEQLFNALEAKNKLGSLVIREDELKTQSLTEWISQFEDTKGPDLSSKDLQKENPTEIILRLMGL